MDPTSDLSQKIADLEQQSRVLETPPERFLQQLHGLGTLVSRFLAVAGDAPAFHQHHGDLQITEGDPVTDTALQTEFQRQLRGGIETASGHFMGYVPGGGLPSAALADLLTAATNRYCGIQFAAPGSVAAENECISWLTGLFEMGPQAWGSLTSGGTAATLNCFLAALEAYPDYDRNQLVIYLGDQSHHCLHRTARAIGIPRQNLRVIATDANGVLATQSLRQALSGDLHAGLRPFVIVGTAGTTNLGAVDPLRELADIARDTGTWFHVDAAYGGFFKLVGALSAMFDGIETADSIVVDPHKGLFLPYGMGAGLVRDRRFLRSAFADSAAYLADTIDPETPSPADYSFELTRHNRAPRLTVPLAQFGIAPFQAALEEKWLLARKLHLAIQHMERLEVHSEPQLSVVAFKGKDETATGRLHAFLNTESPSFVSSTRIRGVTWLRACILSFRTHQAHVDRLIKALTGFR